MQKDIRLKVGFELIRTFDILLYRYSSHLDFESMKTELRQKILSLFSSNPVYFCTNGFKTEESRYWLIDLEHTSGGPCGMITFWEGQKPSMTVYVSKNERFVADQDKGVWINQDQKLLLSKEDYRPKSFLISEVEKDTLTLRLIHPLVMFLETKYQRKGLNFDFRESIFQALQYILESGQFILILYQASWFRHMPFLLFASEYNKMERCNYFEVNEVITSNVKPQPGDHINLVVNNVEATHLTNAIAVQIQKDLTTFSL